MNRRSDNRLRADLIQYWCAILCAAGFVFLFFFMEETNYHREISPGRGAEVDSGADPSAETSETNSKANEKNVAETDLSVSSIATTSHSNKSYWSKLKVFDTKELRYPNHLKGMVLRPLIFLTFPVIFYSGFSYGSNLVWFNVLNGTASLILSENPYGFSSSIVGLCYFSPLIGVVLG